MIDYSRELKEQQQELNRLLAKVKKKQKSYENLPEGTIRVTTSNGSSQYFYTEKGSHKSAYVNSRDRMTLQPLLQREYEEKVLRALEEACRNMDVFLRKYDPKFLDEIYRKLCKGRKKYVTPVALTDEEFAKKWMEENKGGQNPYPEQGKYETERGEMVRSKSEKILADTFYKMNIPYSYEPKVMLSSYKDVYPDFACLNIRTRKTMYWEHFGLLGEEDYVAKNIEKIEAYERSGIFLGDSLITSMETENNPLNMSVIRNKIKTFLT